MLTLARRFTIITISMALFAVGFSVAVSHNSASGSQSHFGANYGCAVNVSSYCKSETP